MSSWPHEPFSIAPSSVCSTIGMPRRSFALLPPPRRADRRRRRDQWYLRAGDRGASHVSRRLVQGLVVRDRPFRRRQQHPSPHRERVGDNSTSLIPPRHPRKRRSRPTTAARRRLVGVVAGRPATGDRIRMAGLSGNEIAESIGKSVAAVKMLQHRAMQRFRRTLAVQAAPGVESHGRSRLERRGAPQSPLGRGSRLRAVRAGRRIGRGDCGPLCHRRRAGTQPDLPGTSPAGASGGKRTGHLAAGARRAADRSGLAFAGDLAASDRGTPRHRRDRRTLLVAALSGGGRWLAGSGPAPMVASAMASSVPDRPTAMPTTIESPIDHAAQEHSVVSYPTIVPGLAIGATGDGPGPETGR